LTLTDAIERERRMTKACTAAWITVTCAALCGCRDDGRLPTYEVTGKVVFSDGGPLPGGWIIFESPEHKKAARGVVETDGTFRLGTYEQEDGAVAGRQLVAITPASPQGIDPDKSTAPPVIDPKYSHMDTSGVEVEVLPDGENEFTITVERPRR
jgi:hypothetical protein